MTESQPPSIAPVFPVLDTLRFLGALAVLTTHVGFQAGEYLRNGTLGIWLSRLDVGVAIFFVLSGFLLCRPWLARAATGFNRPDTTRYARKRLARIMPIYVVTVALALTFAVENREAGWLQWISSMLLLDAYHLSELPHGLTHMWSLSAEVTFYIALPAIMWLAVAPRRLDGRRLALVLGLLVAISLVWHLWLSTAIAGHVTGEPGIWLPAYLTWFAAGMGIAYVDVRRSQGALPKHLHWVVHLGRQPGTCWALAAGLMLVASTEVAGPILIETPTAGESTAKHVIYAAVGAVLCLSGVFVGRGGVYVTVMSHPLPRHLGHISYSIFCTHMLLLITVVFPLAGVDEFSGNGLRVWLVTLVLAVTASEVLYRVVEMPAMRRLATTPRWDRANGTAAAPSATEQEATTR